MQKSIEEKNIQIMKMLDDSIVVIKDCGTEYSDMIKRKLDGYYINILHLYLR